MERRYRVFASLFWLSLPWLLSCFLKDAILGRTVYQYELVPQPQPGVWPLCQGPGPPLTCSTLLNLIKRRNGEVDTDFYGVTCCWQCTNGKNACLGRDVWPGKVLRIDSHHFPDNPWCGSVTTDDFYGDNKRALEMYLEWLVRAYGGDAGLDPGDVKLYILTANPQRAQMHSPGKLLPVR